MASYAIAVAKCQQAWLREYGIPRPIGDPFRRSPIDDSAEAHCALLDAFIHMIPYLIPKDPRLLTSVLWHPDLNGSNIIVSDTLPRVVTSILDWQGAFCAPLIVQACHPSTMEYVPSIDGIVTMINEEVDPLASTESRRMSRAARRATLHRMFDRAVGDHTLFKLAMAHPFREYVGALIHSIPRTWSDGYAWFRENLLRAEEALCDQIPEYVPVPVVPEGEQAAHEAAYDKSLMHLQEFSLIQSELGLRGDGWVVKEGYDEAMDELRRRRREWNEERLGPWPFQDGAWSSDD